MRSSAALRRNYSLLHILLTAVSLTACLRQAGEDRDLDLYHAAMHFGGSAPNNRLPILRLLQDPANNRIANSCLNRASQQKLETLGVDALAERLSTLTKGRVIRLAQDGSCTLAFPALVGDERKALGRIVAEAAARLSPLAERMAVRLGEQVGDRKEMVFHLLWSRVMDDAWGEAWRIAFPDEQLPAVSWVIHPAQTYTMGTNYTGLPGGGTLAISWSEPFTRHLEVIQDASYELYAAAWGKEIQDTAVQSRLREHGALDPEGGLRFFSYRRGEPLDSLLRGLVSEYAFAAHNAYPWSELSRRFGLDRGELFVILLHETAYALFETLHQGSRLTIPTVLLNRGGDSRQTAQLVSISLGDPPGAMDAAMAAYIRNGWQGSPQVVDGFREALKQDPDSGDILWYLGLSLYDVEQYHQAILIFDRLARVTERDPSRQLKHDWALIWMGHVYDVLGDRTRALTQYQRVIDSAAQSGQLQMGQYQIGPVTARDWARQRLESPFRRRN